MLLLFFSPRCSRPTSHHFGRIRLHDLINICAHSRLRLTPNVHHRDSAATLPDKNIRALSPYALAQIIPVVSNGLDAVNFRQMNESSSLHLEKEKPSHSPQHSPRPPSHIPQAVQSQYAVKGGIPGTPGADDGLEPPPQDVDLFGAFSSITLHYDGES